MLLSRNRRLLAIVAIVLAMLFLSGRKGGQAMVCEHFEASTSPPFHCVSNNEQTLIPETSHTVEHSAVGYVLAVLQTEDNLFQLNYRRIAATYC